MLLIGLASATVAAGAAIRLSYLDDIEFKGDEALALILGKDWIDNPCIVRHGMLSGAGVNNPPASVYLFAVIFAISGGDPQSATMVVIIWNIVGLAFAAWWLMARCPTLSPFWAWWSLAYLCFHPWHIIYSRKIWAQDLLMPFLIVGVAGIASIWAGSWRWWRAVVGVVCLTMVSQPHLTGLLYAAGLAVGVIAFWPRAERRRIGPFLALSAAVFLTLYLPWLIHLAKVGFVDVPDSGSGSRLAVFRRIFSLLFHVWAGAGYRRHEYFFGPGEAQQFFSQMGAGWIIFQRLLCLVAGLAMVSALIRIAGSMRQPEDNRFFRSLGLSLCAFLGLVALIRPNAHPHYAIVTIFPMALLIAYGAEGMAQWRGGARRIQYAARTLALLVLVAHLWTALGFLNHIHSTGGTSGDFGKVLRVKLEEVARMKDRPLDEMPLNVYLYLRDYTDDGDISFSVATAKRELAKLHAPAR
jgi:hypothetical protein